MTDHIPPARDTEKPAGNYVLIECGDIEVLLAHMQQGSVTVAVNDQVSTGEPLGKVGNSGNTTEPHLHIHAERDGEPGVILDGQAVPITIAGRYLVRNSVFRGAE
jgi:murein DD-endopeptidase MepM/ murein hydrolase activator NlpD